MNRSAVRIRPPAPQKPARKSGFSRTPWADSYLTLTRPRKGSIVPPPSGDPTKLPAAILRGAPFGLSSPTASQHVLAVTARARLRGGVNFAARLSHGCSFSPSEYTFGGDPLESSILLKGGICFSSFLIKFESRIEIIERRTVFTERRSLCPTENTFGGDPDGERKATRRALRPCLLNYPSGLRGREARRDLQERAQTPAVQV